LSAATSSPDPPLAKRSTELRGGATLLGELLVVRCLAREPEALRIALARVWTALRAAVVGLEPHAPRIWNT
jgi:urease accessory protein UreH